MHHPITDELWAARESSVQQVKRRRGGPVSTTPDRRSIEALLFRARIGIPGRDLSAEFAAWDASETMIDHPRCDVVRRVFSNGTVERNHRPQAGPLRDEDTSGPRQPRLARAAVAIEGS